jgi:predicted HTH domain antitoxin
VQSDSVELTIRVPAAVADADAPERARLLLILDAVRSERMTWRAAARSLGIAPDAFLELARAQGVPSMRYDDDALRDDLSTLAKLEQGRARRE